MARGLGVLGLLLALTACNHVPEETASPVPDATDTADGASDLAPDSTSDATPPDVAPPDGFDATTPETGFTDVDTEGPDIPDAGFQDAGTPDSSLGDSADASPDDTDGSACNPSGATCLDLTTAQVCGPNGFEPAPCPSDTVCYLGQCTDVVCSPDDLPICEAGQRLICGALGTAWVAAPCPAGTGCLDGSCEPLKPNVILVLDTSGSMSILAGTDETYPSTCDAETMTCPPWTWPTCDSPEAPMTRLGRAKQALAALVQSEAANDVRLALQRFPQTGWSFPDCKQGHYSPKGLMTGDQGAHHSDGGWLIGNLDEIMSVPFDPLSDAHDPGAFLRWLDFTEGLTPTGLACVHPYNCPSNICIDSVCYEHVDPELRGIGATPLGRSLFYAGEYLRKHVRLEDKPCESDSDCPSPYHTCVDAACHDPLHACRPNVIILFTDGEESMNPHPTDFFNPVVQAKRLHYGLGCSADAQCASGATCHESRCWPPELPDAPLVNIADPDGYNYLKGWSLRPQPVTIHVVDASPDATDPSAPAGSANAAIAAWGGGQHVAVDLENLDELFAQFALLLDPKSAPTCGAPAP